MHAYGSGIFPGTGSSKDNTENILNIPMRCGTHSTEYLNNFTEQALPFLGRPDVIIVSAGYDAHTRDPMMLMNLQTYVFHTMSASLKELKCPVLFVLEGGYNPEVLAECVEATLTPWMNFP